MKKTLYIQLFLFFTISWQIYSNNSCEDFLYSCCECCFSKEEILKICREEITIEEDKLEINENSKKGLVGLINLGNTCYMNTSLQCLSNCWELTEYFLSNKYKEDINENNPFGSHGDLARAYGGVLKHLWYGSSSYYSPDNFKKILGIYQNRFSGYQQQDTQEFLNYLLDGLHEDLNKVTNKPYFPLDKTDSADEIKSKTAWDRLLQRNQSFLVDLFYGQLKSSLFCQNKECKEINRTFDHFIMLNLPIPISTNLNIQKEEKKKEEKNIYDCFQQFTKTERLDKNNEWYCPKCKQFQQATKKIEIYKTPNILIIQLKRFNNRNKIYNNIKFPIEGLDLNEYVIDKKDNPLYDLFAIANHYGSLNSGHYYAYCKNPFDNKWYEFDDSSVKEIEKENLVTKNAYVLFYKKREIAKEYLKEIYNRKFVDYEKEEKNM